MWTLSNDIKIKEFIKFYSCNTIPINMNYFAIVVHCLLCLPRGLTPVGWTLTPTAALLFWGLNQHALASFQGETAAKADATSLSLRWLRMFKSVQLHCQTSALRYLSAAVWPSALYQLCADLWAQRPTVVTPVRSQSLLLLLLPPSMWIFAPWQVMGTLFLPIDSHHEVLLHKPTLYICVFSLGFSTMTSWPSNQHDAPVTQTSIFY